ncbi:MAG: hypothetical protein COA36_05450 [Desulfotalea sp.]|nr:MAG: hypothetical protein COA36_05450 [Desulfotalea sp.]
MVRDPIFIFGQEPQRKVLIFRSGSQAGDMTWNKGVVDSSGYISESGHPEESCNDDGMAKTIGNCFNRRLYFCFRTASHHFMQQTMLFGVFKNHNVFS